MIYDLPNDIIIYIVSKLDSFSKFSLSLTCKELQSIIDVIFDKKVVDDFFNKKHVLHKYKCRIMNRNLFVESYVLHGECEECKKLGFLRQVTDIDFCPEFPQFKTICLENCNNIYQNTSKYPYKTIYRIWL